MAVLLSEKIELSDMVHEPNQGIMLLSPNRTLGELLASSWDIGECDHIVLGEWHPELTLVEALRKTLAGLRGRS
jgi:hypothetical protein